MSDEMNPWGTDAGDRPHEANYPIGVTLSTPASPLLHPPRPRYPLLCHWHRSSLYNSISSQHPGLLLTGKVPDREVGHSTLTKYRLQEPNKMFF